MKKRTVTEKMQIKRWARKIGKMTAQTEMAALHAKAELEASVRDFMARQERALNRLSGLHCASHRALEEFRAWMRRTAPELEGAIRGPVDRKGKRAMARGRRRAR